MNSEGAKGKRKRKRQRLPWSEIQHEETANPAHTPRTYCRFVREPLVGALLTGPNGIIKGRFVRVRLQSCKYLRRCVQKEWHVQTSTNIFGFFLAIDNSFLTAPEGCRVPYSQLITLAGLTPSSRQTRPDSR